MLFWKIVDFLLVICQDILLLRISRTRKKIHQIKRLGTLKKGSELSVLTALSHLSKGESSTKWARISKKAQFREVVYYILRTTKDKIKGHQMKEKVFQLTRREFYGFSSTIKALVDALIEEI